jgi:tRNA(fMet)-specific endonuclease VapC
MEARFLLDTNICIYIRRKKPEALLKRFGTLRHGEAVLSVLLLANCFPAQRRARIAPWP